MDSKKWYESITVWASKIIIALQAWPLLIAWVDSNFGLHLQSDPIVIKVGTVVAAIVAIYGRLTAKTVIK